MTMRRFTSFFNLAVGSVFLICGTTLLLTRPNSIEKQRFNNLTRSNNIEIERFKNLTRPNAIDLQLFNTRFLGDDADYVRDVTGSCRREYSNKDNIMKWKKLNFDGRYKNPCWHGNDDQLYCLPYMILVGAPKCGTTDLFARISQHPDFVPPTTKETNWLSKTRIDRNESLAMYASTYFSALSNALTQNGSNLNLITGEGSPTYLEGNQDVYMTGANVGQMEPVENHPEYIYHFNNQTRIVIAVRNPVDRLWSEYLAFSKCSNKSAENFHENVKRQLQIYRHCFAKRSVRSCLYDWPLQHFASMDEEDKKQNEGLCSPQCYHRNSEGRPVKCRALAKKYNVHLRRSIYHVFIRDYMRVFPCDQVFVQRLEDKIERPLENLIKVYNFLGLDIPEQSKLDEIVGLGIHNLRKERNKHYTGMLDITRAMLHEFFIPHNRELALLMNSSSYNYGPSG